MGTFSRIVLWALAVVGGVVVVRKYGPTVYSKVKEKALNAGSAVKQLTTGKTVLVPCTAGTNPAGGSRPVNSGVQSSPFFRWCYLVKAGDTSGEIAELIVGDSARYTELLVANPDIPKRGKMGEVIGENAWDFAEGSLKEGTKIFVPQVWNNWIDQMGVAKGGYLPYPPDSRMIVEAGHHDDESSYDEDVITTASTGDGFDYSGA
jgi:hypothetical protein